MLQGNPVLLDRAKGAFSFVTLLWSKQRKVRK